MKLVYCLTSTPEDLYYEQALVSIHTARFHNPESEIILIVDSDTNASLIGDRSGLDSYISEKIVIAVPEKYASNVAKSRYLKLHVRSFVSGTLLFVDTDTIIVSPINEPVDFESEMGMVLDRHQKKRKLADKTFTVFKLLGYSSPSWTDYHNSGVIYMKDTPQTHEFYEQWFLTWEKCFEKGYFVDQPSLADTEKKLGLIKTLPGEWNCQTFVPESLPYFSNAKICHFYGGTGENNVDEWYTLLLKRVKDSGKIVKTDVDFVQNLDSYLLQNELYRIGHTAIYYAIKSVRKKNIRLFRSINSFLNLFRK
jgi:hypothetical protein